MEKKKSNRINDEDTKNQNEEVPGVEEKKIDKPALIENQEEEIQMKKKQRIVEEEEEIEEVNNHKKKIA